MVGEAGKPAELALSSGKAHLKYPWVVLALGMDSMQGQIIPTGRCGREVTMTNLTGHLAETGLRLALKSTDLLIRPFPKHSGCESPDGLVCLMASLRTSLLGGSAAV